MMVQFGFSDHARSRRSRAITCDCRPAKALADGSQPVQSGPAGGTAIAC